jgi:hypothetical protein
MKKYFPLQFHLLFETDLDYNSFIINSQVEKDVPCIFQIWEKKSVERNKVENLEPVNFKFVKKDENPDISFRRVGVNAGFIDTSNLNEKSVQSHYFIKFIESINKNDIINNLKCIIYPSNNTVGPKSISKQEIIKEFNLILQ